MGRKRVGVAAVGVWVVLAALGAFRLGALEREGPAHTSESIGDGIPATLYVPFDDDDGDLPFQRPQGERPPVVVVAHGYSADQAIMSPMARSLAEAGYAVLTFDFRGHGSNVARFAGDLTDDLTAVVDWLERSPQVDGSRIAVLGHSMGASAALDFATLDDRPLAVVPLSGGHQLHDAVVPEHVLLMAAEDDPRRIRDRQNDLAVALSEETDVRLSQIAGKDHLSILFSNTAIREIVDFLDPIMGVERAGAPADLDDPRLGAAVGYLLLSVIGFALLGLLVGRIVEPAAVDGSPGGVLLVLGALVATYPVMAVGGFNVLPLGAGQPVIAQLLLGAALLWGLQALVRRGIVAGPVPGWMGTASWRPDRTTVLSGVAAALALVVLLLPFGPVVHRLVPTPERLVLWVVVALAALPFFLAFEALVRRGSTWAAVGWGLVGRAVLLLVLVVGLGAGVLPPVIGLVVPLLVAQYVLLELFAATCYRNGRNPAVIAVTESVFIAWIVITLTPVG